MKNRSQFEFRTNFLRAHIPDNLALTCSRGVNKNLIFLVIGKAVISLYLFLKKMALCHQILLCSIFTTKGIKGVLYLINWKSQLKPEYPFSKKYEVLLYCPFSTLQRYESGVAVI